MKVLHKIVVVLIATLQLCWLSCNTTGVNSGEISSTKVKISIYAPKQITSEKKLPKLYAEQKNKMYIFIEKNKKEKKHIPLVLTLWTKGWWNESKNKKEILTKYGKLVDYQIAEDKMQAVMDYISDSGFLDLPYVNEIYIEKTKGKVDKVISIASNNKTRYYLYENLDNKQKRIFWKTADLIIGVFMVKNEPVVETGSGKGLLELFEDSLKQPKEKQE